METKRNKQWRKKQCFRVFKARMMREASCSTNWVRGNGMFVQHPHWFELATTRWSKVYKTTSTPCSCWLCQGEHYSRLDFKKETRRMIRESQD